MYPLHDNDLDRLSREAAEQYEVELGASGWDHLEKRLDRELPPKKDRRRFLFWLFLITATTGGALTALLKNPLPVTTLAKNSITINSAGENNSLPTINKANTITASSTQQNQTHSLTDNNIAPDHNNTPNHANVPAAGNTPAATGSSLPELKTGTENAPAAKTTGQPVTQGSGKTPSPKITGYRQRQPLAVNSLPFTLSNRELIPHNNGAGNKRVKPSKQNQHDLVADLNPGQNDQNEQSFKSDGIKNSTQNNAPVTATTDAGKNNDQPVTGTTTPADNTNKPADAGKPVVKDSATTPPSIAKKENAAKKKNDRNRGFELGLVAGPDASTVEFGPIDKAGYNVGLQISYRLSNRWSLNTGIIYTKKFYKADSQYYHGPKYNSVWWQLEDVKGNCSMFDIPVNVRYDVSYNEKRRWFVNAGLSTYIMNNQFYRLNYKVGNWYDPKDSNVNATYKHFFSVLNLSAGYEHSLGRHFSIQAEPYLKIPLKELGYGNMRMDSYGIYFSLKYKPGFNRKK